MGTDAESRRSDEVPESNVTCFREYQLGKSNTIAVSQINYLIELKLYYFITTSYFCIMPKEITEFKKFLQLAKGPKAKDSKAKDVKEKDPKAKDSKDKEAKTKSVKKTILIKKTTKMTKFKVRMGRYLYTFKTDKHDIAKRMTEGIDSNQFDKKQIKKRLVKDKKKQ